MFLGGTGAADGKVASETSVGQHSTSSLSQNEADFLSTLDVSMLQVPEPVLAETAATTSSMELQQQQGASLGSEGLEASFTNGIMGVGEEEGFCEVFTDLTDYLLEVRTLRVLSFFALDAG